MHSYTSDTPLTRRLWHAKLRLPLWTIAHTRVVASSPIDISWLQASEVPQFWTIGSRSRQCPAAALSHIMWQNDAPCQWWPVLWRNHCSIKIHSWIWGLIELWAYPDVGLPIYFLAHLLEEPSASPSLCQWTVQPHCVQLTSLQLSSFFPTYWQYFFTSSVEIWSYFAISLFWNIAYIFFLDLVVLY